MGLGGFRSTVSPIRSTLRYYVSESSAMFACDSFITKPLGTEEQTKLGGLRRFLVDPELANNTVGYTQA